MKIRAITREDREDYLKMTEEFYATDAVIKPVPLSYREKTFEELMKSDTYAACDIFEENGQCVGYALLAKTFSQEAGGIVVWLEELYVREKFRGHGIGKAYFRSLFERRPECVKRFRLEAERENEGAVRLYRSFGFDFLEYESMILDFPEHK